MSGRSMATGVAAVGAGLAGGVFFAFSGFVMNALRKLPPAQGIAAMQSMNRQAVTPAFMVLLFGTALLSTGLGVDAVLHHDRPRAVWVGVGAASYLVQIALTVGFHVPRNDRLADLDPGTHQAVRYWGTYLTQWTVGNHFRTLACIVAATAFTYALRAGR